MVSSGPGPISCLAVVGGIPVRIYEHDAVSASQVDAKPSGARRKKKHEDGLVT